ncbi:unnamed protein product [Rotaria sordida]|uniref:Uncharacterized protein n=1 Tax=Rotaria sordida TaxID=392033 RepID=A0A814DX90_9BILA|nr:unnamed protein product [Rotaria sordida]
MSLLTNEDLDFINEKNEINKFLFFIKEFNDTYKYDGTYGSITGDISNDVPPYPGEGEQFTDVFQTSDYETAITETYSNLASAVNFSQYFGNDEWSITCLPKSARNEPKSRIRKMLPGGKDDKFDGTSSTGTTTNQKRGFLNRIRAGVNTLVRDENNMLFGERSNYDMLQYEDEEDSVDADDLHRYAQQLRDLEDNDREINPEYLVLRDGKTVYAVHETDADGKTTLSTRKPIYDRFFDQTPDDEQIRKMKIFSRIKRTFSRNKQKDKDNLSITSPKSTYDTLNGDRKRNIKKSSSKYIDDGMTTTANSELLMN